MTAARFIVGDALTVLRTMPDASVDLVDDAEADVTAATLFPVAPVMAHPAKFSPGIVDVVARLLAGRLDPGARVLDPFAGTGGIHWLQNFLDVVTVGIELEPEWAAQHPRTIPGDATRLPFPSSTFAAIITSPAYGNRMADQYDGRDGTRRHTYRTALGRPLSPGSGAGLQWGNEYRDLHRAAWAEAHRVLRPGGWLVLNTSDHYRAGVVQPVTAWHLGALGDLGFEQVDAATIETPRNRHGANGALRCEAESVHLLSPPKKADR
jgi:SAM-dependent methyltransferase